jgi:cell division transport system permease protein
MMRRWLYIFDEAFRTVRRHKGLTSISVIIMSLSLLMLAVFLLATDNVLRMVGQAQDEMKMYVYLEDGTSDEQIEQLQRQILSQDEVSTVTFVSREEALADFRNQLGPDADMLSALRTNPLPNSFWVTPRNEFKNRDAMVTLAGRLENLPGVDEVRYGREFLDKFASILSAVFIIANAVRLTVISRRKTIEILKLVGATNPFIVAPFIIEGAFQGGVAAILSLLLLRVITEISSNVITDITFFSLEKSLIFMATCVVIGAIGSFMALRRYLEMR